MTSEPLTPEDLQRLEYILDLKSKLSAEEASLKARVREQFGDGETEVEAPGGTLVLSVVPAVKLDPEFVQKYPKEDYPSYYKSVPNTQAIQDLTDAELLDRFYVKDTSRVSIKFKQEEA
jgi:hypothetical protein